MFVEPLVDLYFEVFQGVFAQFGVEDFAVDRTGAGDVGGSMPVGVVAFFGAERLNLGPA